MTDPCAIHVEVSNRQELLPIDQERIGAVIRAVLQGEGLASAIISVGIVDDPAIHALNVQYLAHDYATDVLSFLLDETDQGPEGEIIVSAEMAARQAPRFAWRAEDELTLYLVHGALHLLGYDDHDAADAARMRQKEQFYLARLGCHRPLPSESDESAPQEGSADDERTPDRFTDE